VAKSKEESHPVVVLTTKDACWTGISGKEATMWYLLFILVNVNEVPGLNTMTVLQTYATSQECQSERFRIGHEMAVAYPDDHDFVLSCRFESRG